MISHLEMLVIGSWLLGTRMIVDLKLGTVIISDWSLVTMMISDWLLAIKNSGDE